MDLHLIQATRARARQGHKLYKWARYLNLTVLLSTQVYEWVPANGPLWWIIQAARARARQGH